MSGWDYWRGTLEAASAQAQAAASQASKFAEVVSMQVSEQSKHIAAQAAQRAGDLSKAAAESTSGARAHLAGIHLPEAFANLSLPTRDAAPAADPEELQRYAIDADFCAFVRGLTYSTFRDFPLEALDKLMVDQASGTASGSGGSSGDENRAPLNPWQARHATLVCLAVKEMNELRFVLVPKRLADEQFWAIYFALTRSRLPPEAFDVELQHRLAAEEAPPEKPKEPKAPLFKSDMIKPAAVAAVDAESGAERGPDGDAEQSKGQTWLQNLVCGFDMEVPAERLQQETIVLGALQSRFQQLSEGARGLSLPETLRIPEHLKHNISANLGNVRDFVGDLVPAAARGGTAAGAGSAAEAAAVMPEAAAAAADAGGASANAAHGNGGAHAAADTPAGANGDSAHHSGGNGDGQALAVASLRDSAARTSPASSPELDTDPDLEAYLKEMAGSDAGSGRGDDDAGSAASLDDGDFDRYLAELSAASGGGDVEGEGEGDGSAGIETGSGEELDLDEYMAAIASDDDGGEDGVDGEGAEQQEGKGAG